MHVSGESFEWTRLFDGLMRIRSSPEERSEACAAPHYAGICRYSDRADAASKVTLEMIGVVLALKAGGAP